MSPRIPVEIGRREWTRVHRIAATNPLVRRHLHPEVARHHNLEKHSESGSTPVWSTISKLLISSDLRSDTNPRIESTAGLKPSSC